MTNDAPQSLPVKEQIFERLQRDRSHTDGSLTEERAVTDQVAPSVLERAVDDVRDADRARTDDDVEKSRERLDERLRESAEVMPRVAAALSEAVDSLGDVADALNEATRASTAAGLSSAGTREASETLSNIAETLSDAAGAETAASADAGKGDAPDVAERFADVAGSMAEVAQRVADERESADALLVEERALIDSLLGRERDRADRTVDFERHQRRVLLEAARKRTDERLTVERRGTDDAVHHSLELLHEEHAAREHAEDRVLTRDEVLAIVSHDLQSPLDAIVINAALLAENAPAGEMQARLQRWAKNIERSAGAMERLLSDLLDVARFEGGGFHIAAEPHDAVGLVKECVETFAPLAAFHGLRLDVDIPDTAVMASYDHPRMLQVMFNLLRNAIQFTATGGSIEISLMPLAAGCLLTVSDTGRGIHPAARERIFDRFHQVKSDDRRGLGLGLYISKRIVDAHSGRIWVESEIGRGSTFFVQLP